MLMKMIIEKHMTIPVADSLYLVESWNITILHYKIYILSDGMYDLIPRKKKSQSTSQDHQCKFASSWLVNNSFANLTAWWFLNSLLGSLSVTQIIHPDVAALNISIIEQMGCWLLKVSIFVYSLEVEWHK